MKRKRYKWIAVVAIVVAVVVGWMAWQQNSEPRYEGKTATQWVHDTDNYRTVRTNEQLQAMMQAMGSNAIPPLIAILTKRDGPLTEIYRQVVFSAAPESVRSHALHRLNDRFQPKLVAMELISMAGTKRAAAIPQLERLAFSTNDWFGIQTLARIGRPAVPALRRIENSGRTSIRTLAIATWSQELRDGDQYRRETAALALSEFDPSSYHPISTLALMCDSRDATIREEAINALSKLVPIHAAARDVVKRATENEDERIRLMARAILSDFYRTNSARPSQSNAN